MTKNTFGESGSYEHVKDAVFDMLVLFGLFWAQLIVVFVSEQSE